MNNTETKEIQLLRAHKAESGLSYPALGQALGVCPATVYNWFRGFQKPSTITKRLIVAYLLSVK